MTKSDWVRKFTSRKFWLALATFTAMMVKAFGYSEQLASEITAIIMAGAAVVAYIIGEGLTDASREEVTLIEMEPQVTEEPVEENAE